MKLIVGLGNPEVRYLLTRHNAGWMAVDVLAGLIGVASFRERYEGLFGRAESLGLLKPLTYMNRSGWSVAAAVGGCGIDLADLLIIVDDVNLPLGAIRFRRGGSSGGHNGLRSIATALETEEFARLRMGVGSPPPDRDQVDHVLDEFTEEEQGLARQTLDTVARAALCWQAEGIGAAMNAFNSGATGQGENCPESC